MATPKPAETDTSKPHRGELALSYQRWLRSLAGREDPQRYGGGLTSGQAAPFFPPARPRGTPRDGGWSAPHVARQTVAHYWGDDGKVANPTLTLVETFCYYMGVKPELWFRDDETGLIVPFGTMAPQFQRGAPREFRPEDMFVWRH